MRRIVMSATAAVRLEHARRWLGSQRADSPVWVVAPTVDAGARILRSGLGARRAALGWERTTPDFLLLRLCTDALARLGTAPASRLALEAIARRSIAAVRAEGRLGRFEAVAERAGLARSLVQTVEELAFARCDAQRLERVAPDLAALIARFQHELADAGLADRAHLHRLALETVQAGGHPAIGAPLLLVDLDLRTPLEQTLYAELFRRSPNALCVGPNSARPSLDPDAAHAALDVAQAEASLYDDALRRLQAHLFRTHAPRGELGEVVSVLSAPGEGRECVEIARRLLWSAERGVPFDEMAVLLRSPLHYRPHLLEALRRAGIPARFSEGSVRPDPAGRALLALLRCRAEGLSTSAFAEYLSLNVVPNTAASDEGPANATTTPEPPVAPRLWERLLDSAAVVRGRERWQRRLQGLDATLALRIATLAHEAQPARAALERQRDALQSLQAFALPLLDALDALPARASWAEWLSALDTLARQALARPARVLDALSELGVLGELGPVELDDVTQVLHPRLVELRVAPSTDTGGAVFVGSIDEARGRSFELVCIPGLAERMFPEKLRQDPILRDLERAAIDPQLVTDGVRAEREREYLALAVGAARNQIVLSYPRIDTDKARPRVPSFYCLEVLRAAEGRLPGFDELMQRAEQAADARIGWPAPRAPEDAIDAAEHDLSLLQRVLAGADAESRGAMRYLLGANPHLARSLRFRARRWETPRWTSADGLVAPSPGAQAALSLHRLQARAYSASALQLYAHCPYRFFLSAVHGLSPRPTGESVEAIDALQRGAIVHDTQFAVLSALRDSNALPLTLALLPQALATLDEELQRVDAEFHDRLAPAIERVWRDGIEAIRADLRGWLERMAADGRWRPLHFELGFGISGAPRADPHSTTSDVALANGIRLRGSIDLVESDGTCLRATDHKTGKPPSEVDLVVGGGQVLQPLLYAMALERLLPGQEVSGGRLYYCTSRGGYEERNVPLDVEARAATRTLFETVDEALGQGFLPAAPQADGCTHCEYLPVCGPYEELRVRRKQPQRLLPLERLRGQR